MPEQIKDILNQDMINEINISFISVLLSLTSAAISAVFVKWAYVNFGKSLNNRESFSDIFILLAVITSVVIIIVKYSLALSLGLVGALSIVRFRAAIKEPEELVYLFLVIALGLAYGANQFLVGFSLTIFSLITIVSLKYLAHKREPGMSFGTIMIITGEKNQYEVWYNDFMENLAKEFESITLKDLSVKSNSVKATYLINLGPDQNIKKQILKKIIETKEVEVEFISDMLLPE